MKEAFQDSNSSEQNNIRSLVTKYGKYWPLFVVCLIIGLSIVYFNIRYFAVNQYEIQSKILIKNTSSGQGLSDVNNISNLGLIKTSHSIDDEIGILTSTGVMEEVVSKNALNITYYIEGSIKDVEIYGEDVPVNILVDETAENLVYGLPISLKFIDGDTYEISANFNDKELRSQHNFGELVSLPFGTFSIVPKVDVSNNGKSRPLFFVVSDKDVVVSSFLRNLSVIPANKTGSLLNLNFISTNKKKGEDILSKLIETYIDKTIKYENELAENTIKMIDDRLKLLSGEIEEVENTVADFKTENVVTDISSNANIYIEQANDYKKRVTEYQTQISVLDGIEQVLMSGENEATIGGASSLNDATLTNLIDRYNETFLNRQQMSQSAVSSNPIIVNLDSNLDNLRRSILQNVRSAKNGMKIARGNLMANASRYDAQIAKVPGMEKKLLEISRDQSTKQGLYLYLLQKREEEVLSLAAPVSSTRIVSLPKAGMFPISPNKKLFYLTGLLLGLFIPSSLIFVKEAFNNKVTDADDLTDRLSAPFLGEIAKSKEKSILLTDEKGVSPTTELFRLLHFNLDYLKKSEKNQTILVTSTVKGEGKTFIASNLAVTLASNGEKVVVLTFDLREPQLMENFNLPNSPGITDFILKKGLDIEEIIQKHPTIEDLWLVGPGALTPQVGRLMLSKRIEVLMEVLKSNFDRIIIDTAPIGLISDAFALNLYIDSTIYVVRKDVTKKESLKTIDNIYRNDKLKNTMVLLNDTKAGDGYGAYGYGKNKA